MRVLAKIACPPILALNAAGWLAAFLADTTNRTNRYRYREPTIKATLTSETGDKCVYCESKIGHNTPGDVEHKIPTSVNANLHFEWTNLTIACNQCNRRKNDYYALGAEFLDPYVDDVEELVQHHGPFVSWRAGSVRAEITVRTLEFAHPSRVPLVMRKMEKIAEFCEVLARLNDEKDPLLALLLAKRLQQFRDRDAEYSAMLIAFARDKGAL